MANNQIDILENLSILANVLQVANYSENLKQTSNDELMKRLEAQDNIYLKTIVAQNNKIIELLEDLKNGHL